MWSEHTAKPRPQVDKVPPGEEFEEKRLVLETDFSGRVKAVSCPDSELFDFPARNLVGASLCDFVDVFAEWRERTGDSQLQLLLLALLDKEQELPGGWPGKGGLLTALGEVTEVLPCRMLWLHGRSYTPGLPAMLLMPLPSFCSTLHATAPCTGMSWRVKLHTPPASGTSAVPHLPAISGATAAGAHGPSSAAAMKTACMQVGCQLHAARGAMPWYCTPYFVGGVGDWCI